MVRKRGIACNKPGNGFTLYHTQQNLRLVKIESICRQQNKRGSNVGIHLQEGRKHSGKRRKCL